MPTTAITTSFYLSMMEFFMAAKQQLIATGVDFGLTNMQSATLLLIDNAKPQSMSSFCKLFHCDASNITGIVDGLEQKRLVRRKEHPADRRIKYIHLEPAGRALKQEMIQSLALSSDYLFAGLSADELTQFVQLMERLTSTGSA